MQRFGIFCLIGLFLACAGACGGGKPDEAKPAAEAATEAAKAEAGAEGDVAKGVQEFAKAMEQLQTSPDGKAYEPVSFTALEGFFPEVGGWEMEKPRGESMTAPVKFSQADDPRVPRSSPSPQTASNSIGRCCPNGLHLPSSIAQHTRRASSSSA